LVAQITRRLRPARRRAEHPRWAQRHHRRPAL